MGIYETTVVLADDHEIVREGIASVCVAHGLKILGQCSDGPGALAMVLELSPDFAVLDQVMPGMTGVEVVRRLRAAGSTSKLMILSLDREEDTVREALQAGVNAYVLKSGPSRHLLEAIGYVRDGGTYLSPLLGGAAFFAREPQDWLRPLSRREREVFRYLAKCLASD